MKKEKIIDERVRSQQNKIKGEAFVILIIVLFISTIIQQYILGASFKQYAVEIISFTGVSFYVVIRNINSGIEIYGEKRKSRKILFLNILITGIIVTIINGTFNYIKYKEHYKENIVPFIAALLITFISATIFTTIVLTFLKYLNDKKQKSISKKFDEEE